MSESALYNYTLGAAPFQNIHFHVAYKRVPLEKVTSFVLPFFSLSLSERGLCMRCGAFLVLVPNWYLLRYPSKVMWEKCSTVLLSLLLHNYCAVSHSIREVSSSQYALYTVQYSSNWCSSILLWTKYIFRSPAQHVNWKHHRRWGSLCRASIYWTERVTAVFRATSSSRRSYISKYGRWRYCSGRGFASDWLNWCPSPQTS